MLFVLVRCLCLGLDVYVNPLFFQSIKDIGYVFIEIWSFVKKTIYLMIHKVGGGVGKYMVYVLCVVKLKCLLGLW